MIWKYRKLAVVEQVVSFPQVKATDTDDLLWVPVKTVTWRITAGPFLATFQWQAKPVTPEAFKRKVLPARELRG